MKEGGGEMEVVPAIKQKLLKKTKKQLNNTIKKHSVPLDGTHSIDSIGAAVAVLAML